MTKKEAIELLKDIKKGNYLGGIIDDPSDESTAFDMAIKALEIEEDFERAQIITGGRLNGRAFAYKCGLEAGKRKVEKLDEIKQVVNAWNNDASHSFSDMCNINKIIKQE